MPEFLEFLEFLEFPRFPGFPDGLPEFPDCLNKKKFPLVVFVGQQISGRKPGISKHTILVG